jgi:hypothetical protein
MAGLKSVQNDEEVRFKSPQQARAVQAVIDMLATMGQGKAMVVILPLIAVMPDLRNRCIKAKISAAA